MTDHIEVDGVRYVREDSLTARGSEASAVLSLEPHDHRSGRSESVVKCPSCGESTGLHLEEVWLENAAGQKLVASSEGEDDHSRIQLNLTDDGHSERRYTLTIAGWCEHCMSFKLQFLQHKGRPFFSKVDG